MRKDTAPERIDVGKHYRDKSGRVGAPVRLNLSDGGWDGKYHFLTHGKNPAEIAAEVGRITAHHQAKAARLTGFQSIDRTFKVRGTNFLIASLTVDERGIDVELRLRVESEGLEVARIRKVFGNVAAVPTDAEIVQIAVAAATEWLDGEDVAASKTAALAALVAPMNGRG